MTDEQFINDLIKNVLDYDFELTRNLLETTSEAKDVNWKEILPIYTSLSKEQKVSFLNFLRVIQINNLSHVLGIIDGAVYFNDKKPQFELMIDNELISGNLQDLFIEKVIG